MRKTKLQKKLNQPVAPISMYVLVEKSAPDIPITFAATQKDALIAVDQYIYLKHYKYFRAWCTLHGYKVDHTTAWKAYTEQVLNAAPPKEPLYELVIMDYDPQIIASLLRTVNQCTPMGLPFETDEELDDYSSYMAEKMERVEAGEDSLTEIEEALDLLFYDLEEEAQEKKKASASTSASSDIDDSLNSSHTPEGHYDA